MSFSLSQREEDHEQLVEKSNRFRILDLGEPTVEIPCVNFETDFPMQKWPEMLGQVSELCWVLEAKKSIE